MTVFMVPELDAEPWPSLGPLVVRWIEQNLVFGPGDKRGEPARVDKEKRALISRMYEVYPRGHPQAGRRRFRRCCISLVKGSAKTELSAWIAACELHPDAPVRCYDFDAKGRPLGQGVTDPYIPMMAYTEEQTEELAYGALKTILENSPQIAKDFDIGLARIVRKDGTGRAEAVAGSPNALDGARTTFQCLDETHRMVLPKLKQAHGIMLRNLVKRRESDPWSLETTTAFAPGELSVAESTMEYARAIAEGRSKEIEPRLFFFHRQASDEHDLEQTDSRRTAVLEAAGPIISQWLNIDAICEQWDETDADKPYLERVHTNRLVQASSKAFDTEQWRKLAHPHEVAAGALITIGFDGSRHLDATGLVATEVTTGYQWVAGVWQRPAHLKKDDEWDVPASDVDTAVDELFSRYEVWRMYCDPPYWETTVAEWSGRYGSERVIPWRTNRWSQMSYALRSFQNAMRDGELSHDGNPAYLAHIGASCRNVLNLRDDKGERMWVIQKERPDSPHKIDLAVAGCLSWEARRDAVTAGAQPAQASRYMTEGIRVFG